MNLLQSLFGLATKSLKRRTGPSKRTQHFRPALEVLESRETPSSLAHDSSVCFVGDTEGKGAISFLGGVVPVQKGIHVSYTSPC